MPIDQLLLMINDLGQMGAQEICLNAQGEPSSHPQFAQIVNAIKDAGMLLTINTNLALSSPKITAALGRTDNLAINISAVNQESYQEIMGPVAKGSLNNVIKNLAYLRSLEKPPSYKLIYIITKNNFYLMGETIEFARTNGIPFITFKIAHTTSETQGLSLKPQERILFLKSISKLMQQSHGIRTNLRELFNEFFTKENVAVPFNHCYIGWLTVDIHQNGAVGACCQNTKLKIGNWKNNTLREIWNSPQAQEVRLLAKDHFHLKKTFGTSCSHCYFAKKNAQIESLLNDQ